MEKAEKWTKFADLWVRAGLSHPVRASQNVMCTHRAAEPQRHTACVFVCVCVRAPLLTQTQAFPSQLNRHDDPAFRNSPFVCLCEYTCCRSFRNNLFQVWTTADILYFIDIFLWCHVQVNVAPNSKLWLKSSWSFFTFCNTVTCC